MPDRGLPESTRKKIETALDKLIELLDEIDGETDAEDDDPAEADGTEEQSLGATAHIDQTKAWAATRAVTMDNYDLEFEADDRPDADAEPSLGSVASHEARSQEYWVAGAGDDREDEHDGAEPDVDGEPWLGSVAVSPNVSQRHWAQGNGFYVDYEFEPKEPDGRISDDILKAKARNRGMYDGTYCDGKLAAQDAMRVLEAIKRKDGCAASRKKPFKPYMIGNLHVIGTAE